MALKRTFPFRTLFQAFIERYSNTPAYWYVPKWRALRPDTIKNIIAILGVLHDVAGDADWNPETQDKCLKACQARGLLNPYEATATQIDRTALTRIALELFATLGLARIFNQRMFLSDAGLDLLTTDDPVGVLSLQIAKYQIPNPTRRPVNNAGFEKGIIPHLFLLQVLSRVGHCSRDEWDLFLNIATTHDDEAFIVNLIESWRSLTEQQQGVLRTQCTSIPRVRLVGPLLPPVPMQTPRAVTIQQDGSYQRRFFAFPPYLTIDGDDVRIADARAVARILAEYIQKLFVRTFASQAEWFAYYGDPDERPSYYGALLAAIEASSDPEQGVVITEPAKLDDTERAELTRRRLEKKIENYYKVRLELLEDGLTLYDKGQQFMTATGPIDLLCLDKQGRPVVVEFKLEDAEDGVFGQVLRYMGFIDRSGVWPPGTVRAIIVAKGFGLKSTLARSALETNRQQRRVKLITHGYDTQSGRFKRPSEID